MLLVLHVLSSLLKAQERQNSLSKIESDIITGRNPNLLLELKKKVDDTKIKEDAILLSNYQSLLGDYFQSKSDIGLAKKYWDKSAFTIESKYGQKSPLMALKFHNLSKYYSYLIKPDSALYFAEKAISIFRKNNGSLEGIRIDKIYKQYGYALKIKCITTNDVLKGTSLARMYLDSAQYFNKRNNYGDMYLAKLYSDMGNTYTDEIVPFQRAGNIKEANIRLKKANDYYDEAIKVMPIELEKTNQLLSNIYLTKGISYIYCFLNDSLEPAIENYQRGIVAITPNYKNQSVLSCPSSSNQFLNESSFLILLHFKIDALYYKYKKTNDIQYLKACYEHSKVAFEVWEDFFTKLQTEEIHLATEMYGAAPFGSSIPYANEYYQITKDKNVAQDVFKWMDLNKYSVLLKQQIDNGNISIKSKTITVADIQHKLKPGQAIIEYYYFDGFNYIIITKDKFEVKKLNLNFKINSKIDSVLTSLKEHNSKEYCSKSKELYDLIFKPVRSNLENNIKELIFIPHDKLFNLPFDALVTNDATTYKEADFLIKHYQISYGLSCNLLFTNDSTPGKFSSISYLNPVFNGDLSLPFSNTLTTNLAADFDSEQYKFQDETKNSILHLSTHAFCDYLDSRNSYLLLSQNEKLILSDLKKKIAPMPLAILSACETGNGSIELGEGVVNFSRQFYLSGIKSTITTLWKVDDEATSDILKVFYNELKNGSNSIEALHKSKLNYLSNVKSVDDYDPYYWSGIIYTGNPVVYEAKTSSKLIWYSLASVGILGVLFFAFRKKFFRN